MKIRVRGPYSKEEIRWLAEVIGDENHTFAVGPTPEEALGKLVWANRSWFDVDQLEYVNGNDKVVLSKDVNLFGDKNE